MKTARQDTPKPMKSMRPTKPTKGEQTAERILDAAEMIFSARGFEAASLREIARQAGIQQPGLYNHFASKRDLYAAVLDRALTPMAEAMTESIHADRSRKPLQKLPSIMTDILLEHPQMASLFQQALQGKDAPGQELMHDWLDRLLAQGVDIARSHATEPIDRAELALEIVALFNVTTGYFLSQRVLDSLSVGKLGDPKNIAKQKLILERIGRAVMRRTRARD